MELQQNILRIRTRTRTRIRTRTRMRSRTRTRTSLSPLTLMLHVWSSRLVCRCAAAQTLYGWTNTQAGCVGGAGGASMFAHTRTRAEKDPQLGGLSSTASTQGGGGGEKGKGLSGEFGKLSCCCYGPFDSVAMVIITAHKDHPSLAGGLFLAAGSGRWLPGQALILLWGRTCMR